MNLDFPTFSRTCIFFHLHLLSSHSFSSLIFSLLFLLFSDSSHLCFPSVHIVGSLTSKLPSIIFHPTSNLSCSRSTHSEPQVFTTENNSSTKKQKKCHTNISISSKSRHRSPFRKKMMRGSQADSGRPRLFKQGFLILQVLLSRRFLSLHRQLPQSQLQTPDPSSAKHVAKQTCT